MTHEHGYILIREELYRDEDRKETTLEVYACECGAGTVVPKYATKISEVSYEKTPKNTDANRIIEAFKEVHNVPSVRPTDRTSARVLSKIYGAEAIIQIIQIMAQARNQPYAPTVNHIKDIETKWIMIGRFIAKNKIVNKSTHGF